MAIQGVGAIASDLIKNIQDTVHVFMNNLGASEYAQALSYSGKAIIKRIAVYHSGGNGYIRIRISVDGNAAVTTYLSATSRLASEDNTNTRWDIHTDLMVKNNILIEIGNANSVQNNLESIIEFTI